MKALEYQSRAHDAKKTKNKKKTVLYAGVIR